MKSLKNKNQYKREFSFPSLLCILIMYHEKFLKQQIVLMNTVVFFNNYINR